mmetsp:Transcript_36203/g.75699  ORF Transcript_36203/g.75699 Transcript_36203/m.75699 type:complete len:81 (-) Transcript_36203:23-265(-)
MHQLVHAIMSNMDKSRLEGNFSRYLSDLQPFRGTLNLLQVGAGLLYDSSRTITLWMKMDEFVQQVHENGFISTTQQHNTE